MIHAFIPMTVLLDNLLLVVAAALSVPIGVFVVECLLAALPAARRRETGPRPPAIVLIPAHNEESGLAATLGTLLPTLGPSDRVLVVADNCTDRTAEVARDLGADVVERHDAERRGKGFALERGIQEISRWSCGDTPPCPPDAKHDPAPLRHPGCSKPQPGCDTVVVFLDADCRVTPDTVDQLARAVARTGGPVQGLNLSEAERSGVQAVSSLGFHFKNHVRPAGLARVGLPCHLMGTGMALPWSVASTAGFGGAHLAEDMQLGVDLALAGKPTTFCPTALVTSRLPTGKSAFLTQRTRWEHGHLRTSLTQIPRLLRGFLRRGDLRTLALALDLTVPPFSMLLFVWLAALAAGSLSALAGGSSLPAAWLAAAGLGIVVATLSGWARYCRHVVPFSAFAGIPAYMFRKLPIYFAFVLRRGPRGWVRTER